MHFINRKNFNIQAEKPNFKIPIKIQDKTEEPVFIIKKICEEVLIVFQFDFQWKFK
jgi:hypothetical protein